jgi:cobalt-zinc-cadmium efflux system outer membrane protein
MRFRTALLALCVASAPPLIAQTTSLTRAGAVQNALMRGPRLGVAGADTTVANAQVIAARVFPNPALTANYSKAVPTYHVSVDVPLDFPNLRQLRIRSAELGAQAAQLRYQFARASIALDADTTYTRAVAARERLALSRRTAQGADSILSMVETRQRAGDASDMDVELARIMAGQFANAAAVDSLSLVSSLLDLQAVLGMSDERLAVSVTDSLTMPPEAVAPGQTLNEASAVLSAQSADLNAQLQHRPVWLMPSVSVGFEHGDHDQPGILPTFGSGIGLPLFDRNRGGIAVADAERARASAELALTKVEMRNQVAHATREREMALARVTRDRQLVESANRVAAMAFTAYREGAASLTNIIEARRDATAVLAQYIDDLAAAWIATAELRALASSETGPQR